MATSDDTTLATRFAAAQVSTNISTTAIPPAAGGDITSTFPATPIAIGDITVLPLVGNSVPFPPQDFRLNSAVAYIFGAAGYADATQLELVLGYGDDTVVLGQATGIIGTSIALIMDFPAGPIVGSLASKRAFFDLSSMQGHKSIGSTAGGPLLIYAWLRTNGGTVRLQGLQICFTAALPWPGALRALVP